ncbi:hypothetical protein HWI79_2822 [Cryptosporidium felis]|nr:hypothetical protein HWI79_2822 [Cryptosporidium felis]
MQSSRSITSQFEELIKKAKLLSKTHEVVPEITEVVKNNVSRPAFFEVSMLEKRHEMCVVQKNTIKDLIKLHKEEILLLESALRTIESEEKKILEIILKESVEESPLTRATSVELIEHDNDSSNTNSLFLSQDPVATEYHDKSGNEISKEFDESYVKQFGEIGEGYLKSEPESEESEESNSHSERENSPKKQLRSRRSNSNRRVRFSLKELGVISDSDSKQSNSELNSVQNFSSTSRPSNPIRATISIPQRFNYIRNRNSSLMKEVSIRKILDGNRKLAPEERDQDQKAMIRRLHSIYASKR